MGEIIVRKTWLKNTEFLLTRYHRLLDFKAKDISDTFSFSMIISQKWENSPLLLR